MSLTLRRHDGPWTYRYNNHPTTHTGSFRPLCLAIYPVFRSLLLSSRDPEYLQVGASFLYGYPTSGARMPGCGLLSTRRVSTPPYF